MQLIPLSQRFIAGKSERTVSARKLHAFLGVGRGFNAWITGQIDRYEFRENQDFVRILSKTGQNSGRGRPEANYYLTLDMAKELAMVSRTGKGREARRYFIDCERQLNEQREQQIRAQQQESLPAPTGPAPLSKEIRSAINRKAHSISLSAYESARDQITNWLEERRARGESEEQLKNLLYSMGAPRGEQQLIETHRLWYITSGIIAMRNVLDGMIDAIHALEKETGRPWYRHPQP